MAAAPAAGIVVPMRETSMGTKKMKLGFAVAATIVALFVTGESAATAAPDRSAYVPAGLTGTVSTAHFIVHYAPGTPVVGMTIDQYAQAGAADFEEAYGHDVLGGGLAPNAGLRVPVDDGDAKTDVYLAAPKNNPGYSGGVVYSDLLPANSSYVFMTPNLSRPSFRFRAAHEFMHVIQGAYAPHLGEGLLEAFANWAAEWALPDIDPLDSNFYPESLEAPHPWLPLDCSYGSWKANPCGNGYWQWLFVQAQVEDFGPGFVSGYYERWASTLNGNLDFLLGSEIEAASGGTQTLSSRFAAYAVKVWDPTRWSTRAIERILTELGLRPASYIYFRSTRDTGVISIAVDHLAARYVRFHNYAAAAAPGETVQFEWTRPAGMVGPVVPLVKYAGRQDWVAVGSFAGTSGSASAPFGPDVEDVVLPLVNDSIGADDQPFSYRAQILAPPDTKAPRTRIRRHPPKRTRSRLAVFTFGADESAHYECKLDRRKFKPCGTRTRLHVKLGRHTLRVRAIDRAGNVDATPARFSWKVVKHLPKRQHRR